MRPTFAQLEAFYWVGRLGGFHAAARQLHLTQPTISARIAELEFTLGEKLFERSRQRVELTVYGQNISSSIERILRISDEITIQKRSLTLRGLLRLGAVESVAFFMLPILLSRLRSSFPELKIELTLDVGTVLNRKLNARELDIAILTDAQVGNDVTVEQLGAFRYSWVAGHSLTLPNRAVVPSDLCDLPILVHPERSTIFSMMSEWFRGGGVEPKRLTLCNSLSLTGRLVAAGYGVSILQPDTLRTEIETGVIRVLSATPEIPSRTLMVAYHDNSPSYRILIEMIKDGLAESGLFGSGAVTADGGRT